VTGQSFLSSVTQGATTGKTPLQSVEVSSRPAVETAARPELRILFVALVNNIGCERVIMEMSRHGALCALMSPRDYYCTKIQSIARRFSLPECGSVWLTSLFVRRRLEAAVHDWRPSLVVPLDDISAWLLRSLATDSTVTEMVRDLLVESFGSPAGYRAATDRNMLMEVASRVGVRKPQHRRVSGATKELRVPDDWTFPLFLKTEHSCGGDGVTAVRDQAQLNQQLIAKGLRGPKRRLVSWIKNALRASAGFHVSSDDEMIVQSFARGRPAFRTVTAKNGRVLAGVSFAAEKIHPEPTGASTIIRSIVNAEMDEIAAAVTAELGCSGFVSFDFMLDAEHGRATLIEMNARCVGSCHLGGLFGYDICGALVAELTGAITGKPEEKTGPELIALFPKELERDPASPFLSSSDILHDIPQGERELIAAYEQRLFKLHPSQAGLIHRFIERGTIPCSCGPHDSTGALRSGEIAQSPLV
jgi:hypothetical protein